MTTRALRKFIGMRIRGGIVTGARMIDRVTVEFDVLVDGIVEQHRITL